MPKRWIIVAISLLSACCFALSVWAGMLWSVGQFDIGPLGIHHCSGGECTNQGLAWANGSERWLRTANGVAAAGVIAMLAQLIVAGALAAGRVPKLASRGCIAAVVTAIAVGVLFVAGAPAMQHASPDRGMYLYFAACVIGFVAPILTLRAKQPS